MIPIPKSWILYGAGAIIFALFTALMVEKGAHTKALRKLAEEKRLHAVDQQQWAKDAALRASVAITAIQRAENELDRQARANNKLRATHSQELAQLTVEIKAANQQIDALENENADLKDWADTRYPVAYADWMREPAHP